MSFFKNFIAFFRLTSDTILTDYTFDKTLPDPPRSSLIGEHEVAWLLNEDNIKDEAVIYGISGAPISEKLLVIEGHFDAKVQHVQKDLNILDEKILVLNLKLENLTIKQEEKKAKIKHATNTDYFKTNWVRILAGLVLSICMCVGNFYLLQYWLKPIITHNWILWGLFLTGTFSLFTPFSLFHTQGAKPAWRQWVEELGLPVSVSVFIFIFSFKTVGLLNASGFFVFQIFTFLLTGKLLLANIILMQETV